jgi:hypothetical protein
MRLAFLSDVNILEASPAADVKPAESQPTCEVRQSWQVPHECDTYFYFLPPHIPHITLREQ